MRASWSALHLSLLATLNRRSSEEAFERLRQGSDVLQEFPCIADLVAHQHGACGTLQTRNDTLQALVVAAQTRAIEASVAVLVLLVALWPGLDAALGRLVRKFRGEADIAEDLLGEVTQAIARVDLSAVHAIAATLIRNAERDVGRSILRRQARMGREMPIDDPAIEASAAMAWPSVVPGQAEGSCNLAELLVPLAPLDWLLLQRVFVLGETQEGAGRALNLSPSAARKRFQRALTRLRQNIH